MRKGHQECKRQVGYYVEKGEKNQEIKQKEYSECKKTGDGDKGREEHRCHPPSSPSTLKLSLLGIR